MPLSQEIRVIAPAKINLNLHIVGTNTQGYHLIEGVTVFTEFGDNLTLSVNNLGIDSLKITGQFSHILAHEDPADNLIMRAVKALRHYADFANITLTLTKNIPIQAGFGGGSSNAAATLKAVDRLFSLNISDKILYKIAQTLGADVPMCLYAKPCLIKNIGDHLTPIKPLNQELHCILLKPLDVMLSTPKIFKALTHKNNPPMPNSIPPMNYALSPESRNDLWLTAEKIAPNLQQYLTALQETNPIKAAMSGSGSGFFALYEHAEQCQYAQVYLHNQDVFLIATKVYI